MQFKTFVQSGNRPGVWDAVETIIQNLEDRKDTTTIVLPMRYGKSDSERLTAIECRARGLVSTTAILAPWIPLRNQLRSKKRLDKMYARYFALAPQPPSEITHDVLIGGFSPRFDDDAGGRDFWVTTIGQILEPASRLALCNAATSYIDAKRPRLLVIIDECQYVGTDLPWGKLAEALVKAGAHVALFTGTPERADKVAPFGFETRPISREPTKWSKLRIDDNDQKWADIYKGYKAQYVLKADLEVPLEAAWDARLLTKLEPQFCGFLSDGVKLESLKSVAATRTALWEGLRNPAIMTTFLECGIRDVASRRDTRPDSAMLVFVGSDHKEDNEWNWHPREVRRILRALWRQHFGVDGDIHIATLDERGEGKAAAKTIAEFTGSSYNSKGEEVATSSCGDVLIVKQMGCVGMDVERAKTAVDLSMTRSYSATAQRWLRICTLWDDVQTATIVLPNDYVTQDLWERIVVANGGEYNVTEDGEFIGSKPVDSDPDKVNRPEVTDPYRAGAGDAGTQTYIGGVEDTSVDKVLASQPFLIERLSRVEIWKLINTGLVIVPENVEPTRTVIRDVELEVTTLRESIIELVKGIVQAETPYRGTSDGGEYGDALARCFRRVCDRADIEGQLKYCRNVEKLKKAQIVAEQMSSGKSL